MKRAIIMILTSFFVFLSGCSPKKHEVIRNRLDANEIPDCYETNRNIFGEFTGDVFKCGNLIFYSQYTYEHQKFNLKKSDGLYVTDESGKLNYKLADGIIFSIVVREDGVYYLKENQKGKIYLYNWDLYRYSFKTGKNELIINDCTFVQFSRDCVYYCQHYFSDKDSYVENDLPLNLENEGKIVKHSLLTGEETVVAEVEGGIYHFRVGDGIIAFSGGSGSPDSGGQNLYICRLDGSNLQKLTENDHGNIKVLYVDEKCVIYSANLFNESAYCCMALDSEEVVWSYPRKNLTALGAYGSPVVLDGKLFFRRDGSEYELDTIICLDANEKSGTIKLLKTPGPCLSLYVFDGKLYASDSKHHPGSLDPMDFLKEIA